MTSKQARYEGSRREAADCDVRPSTNTAQKIGSGPPGAMNLAPTLSFGLR